MSKETRFPVIDSDPHFKRVVGYFRPADYALWAAAAGAFPAAVYGMELAAPTRLPRAGLSPTLRLATFLGISGGFLLAYQQSTKRFWGWSENAAEIEKDQAELSARVAAGQKPYGDSDLPDHILGVASRNSTWSQTKFSALPWFNFVNHGHHGSDESKYKE